MMARCLCGTVEIEITGKVGPLVYCHCTRCQKSSGSAFSANANVRRRYWRWVRGETAVREHASSPGVFRAFCSTCGSPVYSRWETDSDMLRLRLGLLEGDPGRRALARFWVGDAAPWYELTDALPRFAQGPDEHATELATLAAQPTPSRPTR